MTAAPSSRRLSALLLLGVGAATLSACGMPARQTAAAVVDGRTISADSLDATLRDLSSINPQIKADDPDARSQVLSILVQAPFVIDEARAAGKWTEAGAYAQIMNELPHASSGTKEFATMASIVGQDNPHPLTEADVRKIQARIESADIQINPRYGRLDPKTMSVEAFTPDWIVSKAATPNDPSGLTP